ncbi:MAG: CubicO group peptidase (beta-lactamase class C family) [Flavobacteriales bacterium]|jgi:CubicO group peptidase (beta-lactamase class C family)
MKIVRMALLSLNLSFGLSFGLFFGLGISLNGHAQVGELRNYLNDSDFNDNYWKNSTPAAEGLDTKRLDEALEFIRETKMELHSFTIIKNGKLVFDYYGTEEKDSKTIQRTPAHTHTLYSTTKTLTSALIGIAIAENTLSGVNQKVLPFFANDSIENITDEKRNITIENLLTMQSGLQYKEGELDALFNSNRASATEFLTRPLIHKPGSHWNYSSGDSQILSEIVRRSTGSTPQNYAYKKLFKPLGIRKPQWSADKSGTNYGGWGLFLTPRDLARVGYLYLQNGRWEGQQLIPQTWIADSTQAKVKSAWSGHYAYHCWAPTIGGFATQGYMGQNMYVFPDRDLIVVFTANLDGNTADSTLSDLVRDYIL